MRERKNLLSISALAVSVLTLVLVGTMFWSDWQRNNPDTNEITIHLLMRFDNAEIGDICPVAVERERGLVSWLSEQLVVETADGKIVGETPINNGVVEDRGHANYCVKTVTLEVEDSDYYLFGVYEWHQRVVSSDSLERSNWEVVIYLDE